MERIDWKLALEKARQSLQNETGMLDGADKGLSYTVPPFNCPICGGIGWVYLAENTMYYPDGRLNPNFGKAYPCKCRKMELEEKRRFALLKFCGLPKESDGLILDYFDVNRDTFKPEKLREALGSALDLIMGNITFLTLIGPVNAGKTHLGVACCREYIRVKIPAKYVFTPNMLDDLRNSYNDDAEVGYQKLIRKYYEVPLLVLDDIYRQKPSLWGSEKLMQIIHIRHQERRATICTTNRTFEEIMKIDPEQGEAIVSRLQRESWCRVVSIS